MPNKDEGDDKKSTKDVVNKKQKQMMNQEDYLPEEGYDVARDEGKVKSSKDKKDATSMPVSDEVKKTQKKNKGPSALERVKADIEKRYGKDAIMKIKKEELDLTKVAESFGGQIVGEPVELDETPLLAIPAIKYGVPAAIAITAAGYDSYQKMRGKKGILPDLSGAVKKVGDTYNKAKDSIMRISGGTGQQKQNQDSRRRSKGGGAYSGGGNQNQNQNQNNKKKKFNNKNNNNKNIEPPEVKGDPLKINYGTYTKGAKNDKTKNVFSRIKDIVVGKNKTGQLLRTAGVSGTTATGVTTALKNRRGFRPPGLRVPDGGHVGRRTAG